MSARHLSDAELFRRAVFAARQARFWRACATRVEGLAVRTYQRYARQYETQVFNLSIVAEMRCERESHSTQG